jgi:hypothetical protein
MTVFPLLALLVAPSESPRSVKVPRGAVVKTAPHRQSKTIGVLARGAQVGYRGSYEDWIAVEPRGWVKSERVEPSLDPAPPPHTVPTFSRRSWRRLRRHPSAFEGVWLDGAKTVTLPIAWNREREVVFLDEADDGHPRKGLHIARETQPPRGIGPSERWIDVDLDEQVLVAYEGTTAVFATLVSTGSYKHKTPLGLFRIRAKKLHTDMKSGPDDPEPYEVKDVPYAMYFHKAYALHGAYWHDGFGRPRSHGCINLSPEDARLIFDWVAPRTVAGWRTAVAGREEGTAVRIRRSRAKLRRR